MRMIYAIRDRVANDLAGYFPLVVMRTDQQAIRYFADSCAMNEQNHRSAIAAHPADYELIACGTIEENGEITAQRTRVILTGDALLAMQTQHTPLKVEA